jgi:hypothetical protein
MRHHGVRQGTPPGDCAGTDRELRRSGCAPKPLVGQILDSVTTQVNATVAPFGTVSTRQWVAEEAKAGYAHDWLLRR